jgi:hypothetical protein
MTAEDALLNLLESTSFADFQQRRDRLAALVAQENLIARRDALMAQPGDPWADPGPKKSDPSPKRLDPAMFSDNAAERAQAQLLARRDALMAQGDRKADEQAKAQAEAAWKRAVEAPMFTDAQRTFVRQAEFLLYMKALDELILAFDRSNTFNLVEALDKTAQKLNALRTMALGMRETLGAAAALAPGLPRKLYARLVRGTFIRYIRWQAALDLDRRGGGAR